MRLRRFWGLMILLLSMTACAAQIPAAGSSALAQEPLDTQTTTPEKPSPTVTLQPTHTATVIPDTATLQPTHTATVIPDTATVVPDTETPSPSPVPTIPATLTPTLAPTSTPDMTPTATYPPPPEEVRVPILMYHYISELPPDADIYRADLTVTPGHLDAQLQYLQAQGYHTVRLVDIYNTLSTGAPLPVNPIVLTFDDGYKDAYTNALPLLQSYGFTAEFFILATPAHYEAQAYLTWNDVRIMADNGMSMQAHGRDHYDLTNRDYDFLVYQILGAKEAVEAHSDANVTFFCYPSGRYDDATQAVVKSAGYLGALTTEWGTVQRLDNRYTWPRIRIKGAWTLETFAGIMAALKE